LITYKQTAKKDPVAIMQQESPKIQSTKK